MDGLLCLILCIFRHICSVYYDAWRRHTGSAYALQTTATDVRIGDENLVRLAIRFTLGHTRNRAIGSGGALGWDQRLSQCYEAQNKETRDAQSTRPGNHI